MVIWYVRHRRLLYKGFLEVCAVFCVFVCGYFSDERGYLFHQPCEKEEQQWLNPVVLFHIVALNTFSSLRSRTFPILHIQLGKCVLWQTTSRLLFLSFCLTLRISKTGDIWSWFYYVSYGLRAAVITQGGLWVPRGQNIYFCFSF